MASESEVASWIANLDHEDMAVTLQSSAALVKANGQAVAPLIAVLNHPGAVVRWRAAVILGLLRDPRAVTALIKTLDDPESDVRYSAAWAMGYIGDRQAFEPLTLALDDVDEWVVMGKVLALIAVDSHRAVDYLREEIIKRDARFSKIIGSVLASLKHS